MYLRRVSRPVTLRLQTVWSPASEAMRVWPKRTWPANISVPDLLTDTSISKARWSHRQSLRRRFFRTARLQWSPILMRSPTLPAAGASTLCSNIPRTWQWMCSLSCHPAFLLQHWMNPVPAWKRRISLRSTAIRAWSVLRKWWIPLVLIRRILPS